MATEFVQNLPETLQTRPIQFEGRDCRPTGWRASDYFRKIRFPGEVILPSLPARMEQGHGFRGDWIGRVYFGCLVSVAALASESTVAEFIRTSTAAWLDVLDRERCG